MNLRTGKVEGIVFEDKNANGSRDPGEPGIPDVRVMVKDSSNKVQIKVTNSDGKYIADVPVGTTVTSIVESTLPSDFVRTSDDWKTTLNVPADGTVFDADGYTSAEPTQRPSPEPTSRPTPDPTPRPTTNPLPPIRPPTSQPITPQPTMAPPTSMPTSTITNSEIMTEVITNGNHKICTRRR